MVLRGKKRKREGCKAHAIILKKQRERKGIGGGKAMRKRGSSKILQKAGGIYPWPE